MINRMDTFVVVIPARMASSRFPGKPLVSIAGLPLVEHVRRRALLAKGASDVVVATCDESIRDAIVGFGGRAVMTADTHERCTGRLSEAMRHLTGEIVVMVQGDEPLLLPEAVERIAAPLLADPSITCTNLLSPLESRADRDNPDIVKAACSQAGEVMFLSRSPIPHYRMDVDCPVYRQTGIMGFRASLLRTYESLPATPFERAESIDMLRLLEHGYRITGVVVDCPTYGVDRPADVEVIEQLLRDDETQRGLHARIHQPIL